MVELRAFNSSYENFSSRVPSNYCDGAQLGRQSALAHPRSDYGVNRIRVRELRGRTDAGGSGSDRNGDGCPTDNHCSQAGHISQQSHVVIHRGETLEVSLVKKKALPWEPPKTDGALLSTVSASNPDGGYIGYYKAIAYGVALIQGRFPCGGTACAAVPLWIYVYIVDSSTPPLPVASASATLVIPTAGFRTLFENHMILATGAGMQPRVTLKSGQSLAMVSLDSLKTVPSTSDARVLSIVGTSQPGTTTVTLFHAAAPGTALVTAGCPPVYCPADGLTLEVEVS